MRKVVRRGAALLASMAAVAAIAPAADAPAEIVQLGAGSYTTDLPQGGQRPWQIEDLRTDASKPRPSNRIDSSTLWQAMRTHPDIRDNPGADDRFGERHFPYPLAVLNAKNGLRAGYAARSQWWGMTPPNFDCICSGVSSAGDLVIGATVNGAPVEFTRLRVVRPMDEGWFTTNRYSAGDGDTPTDIMDVTYGQGSPFLFASYHDPDATSPRITVKGTPALFHGSAGEQVLGVRIDGKPYALFAPSGSDGWAIQTYVDDNVTYTVFTVDDMGPGGRRDITAAVLPDEQPATLEKFEQYAYNHVVDTRVTYDYDEPSSEVEATFTYEVSKKEAGKPDGTLFALYPHQHKHTSTPLFSPAKEYPTVWGTMKLGEGTGFRTVHRYTGVLPTLPKADGVDAQRLRQLIDEELTSGRGIPADTYWLGKRLGFLTGMARIAEQIGYQEAAAQVHNELRARLTEWFTATRNGQPKTSGQQVLYYDEDADSVIGFPSSFGSSTDLNDHAFHYGYFIRAAAEVARVDPQWAQDYGPMVELMIRDIAAAPGDDMFPAHRGFDPYSGHGWASGHGFFADGNNLESSSEEMGAWTGLILWGSITGDEEIRDRGIAFYATAKAAIDNYWFDVDGDVHDPRYEPIMVTLLFGGKLSRTNWFHPAPETQHGIQYLPLHGGSLYLGTDPEYVRRNVAELEQRHEAYVALHPPGTKTETGFVHCSVAGPWCQWEDLVEMYRALGDPDTANEWLEERLDVYAPEEGVTKAEAYHWIKTLQQVGQVDDSVSADHPHAVVFRRDRVLTYVAYNPSDAEVTVTFSDGHELGVPPGELVSERVEPPAEPVDTDPSDPAEPSNPKPTKPKPTKPKPTKPKPTKPKPGGSTGSTTPPPPGIPPAPPAGPASPAGPPPLNQPSLPGGRPGSGSPSPATGGLRMVFPRRKRPTARVPSVRGGKIRVHRSHRRRASKLRLLAVECTGGGPCAGTVEVKVAIGRPRARNVHRLRLARKVVDLAPNASTPVVVSLPKRVRAALRGRRLVTLTVRLAPRGVRAKTRTFQVTAR